MAQIAYGTITITDTNDIESIVVEYAQNQSNSDAPTSGWSTTRPAWTQGYFIWQRTRTHKTGTETSADTIGTAVCITGSTGQSLASTKTQYTNVASNITITTSNHTNYTWTDDVPAYNSSKPAYWARVTNTYQNPARTEYLIYKDQGITDAIKTSHDANTTANEAKGLSEQTHVDVVNLQTRTKYFWTNLVAHTNGTSGWTKPNYPVGTYAASGISGTTFDEENSSTYGYNTLYSNGIKLRYNAINLGELNGTYLTFYNPSTTSQGTKAMELSGSTLKFYASNGSTVQAEFGGTKARVSGTIEALDGQIGNNANNYWYIGNYVDYNQNQSAAIKSYGTAFIQLGTSNTWRIATNRFHSAWNDDSSGTSGQLHYPVYDNKYWDSGLHLPTSLTDKFLYIRNAPNTQTLENLQNDLEDSGYDYWTYRFYISADGSLYARNLYVLDDNGNTTQIGGTDGVYLLKSGGTITGNLTVNGTITGNLTGNVTGNVTGSAGKLSNTSKIGDTNKPVYFTANGVPTAISYEINKTVPSNAIFTDANVTQTATTTNSVYELLFSGTADNTTRTEGTRKTSTLTYNPSTKALVTGGTVNGYTLAAASAKGVDTSMTASSTSTNLPTTKAVADLIKTYLPLSGGTVSGETIFNDAVSVNDEFDADSITTGNLIVTGVGRFTNGIYGDLTGNVTGNVTGSVTGNATTATTATKVGSNLVIKIASGTTEGTNMFTYNGSAAKTVDITKSAIGLGNVENKSSATIRGELTSANVTTALGFTPYNSTNPNGYVTSSGVTSVTIAATSPVVSSTATAQTGSSVSTTISLANSYGDTKNPYGNKTANYVLAGPSSGNAAAPTFRALVAADIPSITKSKISDFPASLKNPNALKIKVYSGTSASTDTSYDGSTANQSVEVAGKGAITGVTAGPKSESSDVTTFTLTKADGTTSTFDISIVASEATGATTLRDSSGPINKGSATKPVYFSSGVPVEANTYAGGTAVTLNGSSKASSTASFYAPTSAGTSGQVLTSSGGTPGWTNQSSLSVGSATTATKFNSNRTIALTGDVTGSVSGDGSSGWSIATTVQDNSHNHNSTTITPIVTKTYANTSYYATTSGSWDTSSWYFISVKPDSWYKPWTIKFKVHSYCPSYTNIDSVSYCTVSGRADSVIYSNWNERYDPAHYYMVYYPLKNAGFNAGYGHAIGVSILYGTSYTTAAYYRTFEVDYFECENCTVTLLDTPVKWANWSGNGTTNYGSLGSMNAVDRGMKESGDNNDTTTLQYSTSRLTAGSNGMSAYSIIMQKPDGTWEGLTTGNATTATTSTKNTSGFVLGQMYLYWSSTNLAAAAITGTSAIRTAQDWVDARYTFNAGTTLTTNAMVYIKGTITNGLFYLADTWWTQTLPTSNDGFVYIPVGMAYSNYTICFWGWHGAYYHNGTTLVEYNLYAVNATKATQDDAGNTISSTYLKKSGGTMTGGVTFVGNQSSAWNDKGVLFTNGSRIGENSTGGLGIYAKDKVILRPASGTSAGTDGVEITTTGLMPTNNNSESLGGASNKWSNVYATTFNGALSGNATSATKANLTTTANAIAYYTGTDGTFGTKASANGALYATAANGALSWGTLPVGQGGTGATSFTANSLIMSGSSTTAALTTRGIRNNTTKSSLGWTSTSADIVIPTVNTIAYWNGAYDTNNNSNLTYCVKGAFGTATTKDSTTSVASGGAGLPTAGAVYTAIRAASDTYVTLTTAQTISGIKTFSNGAKFGTHWDISEDSTTNALVFKYTA